MVEFETADDCLENIPRVRAQDYLANQSLLPPIFAEPIIFTDLFSRQPILKLSECQDSMLSSISLRVIKIAENFTRKSKTLKCTYREYLESVRLNPDLGLWCEQPLPNELRKLISMPVPLDQPDYNASWYMFLSNAKTQLSLHFDIDFRHNLMLQLFGTKRYVLISPRYSKRLIPYFNFSLLALKNFDKAEKREFLKYNKAFECVLHPAETLFIPKSWWHYIEYLDLSMSVSLRYARTPFDKGFALLPRSYLLQNIANDIIEERSGSVLFPSQFNELFDSYYRESANPLELYKRFYDTKKKLYREISTASLQGTYVNDAFNLELRRIRSRKGQMGPLSQPIAYEGSNPDKPISNKQMKLIAELARRNPSICLDTEFFAYSGQRKKLEDFTRLEAAQVVDLLLNLSSHHHH